MARITRNKAAEILGLSRQTVSNYIEQGLIGSCVGEHGILYVNSEDVEKYAEKYKMLAANEKMIDDKLKEVEAHKRAINDSSLFMHAFVDGSVEYRKKIDEILSSK